MVNVGAGLVSGAAMDILNWDACSHLVVNFTSAAGATDVNTSAAAQLGSPTGTADTTAAALQAAQRRYRPSSPPTDHPQTSSQAAAAVAGAPEALSAAAAAPTGNVAPHAASAAAPAGNADPHAASAAAATGAGSSVLSGLSEIPPAAAGGRPVNRRHPPHVTIPDAPAAPSENTSEEAAEQQQQPHGKLDFLKTTDGQRTLDIIKGRLASSIYLVHNNLCGPVQNVKDRMAQPEQFPDGYQGDPDLFPARMFGLKPDPLLMTAFWPVEEIAQGEYFGALRGKGTWKQEGMQCMCGLGCIGIP